MAGKSRQSKAQRKRPAVMQAAKTASVSSRASQPWRIAAVCFLLAAVTIITYWGVRNNDFLTYDDNYYVSQNQHVQHGLTAQSIAWAFTTFERSNWHPLAWISHMIDWSLYGNNPAGHHLTNVFIHSANAILLFLFLLYITGYLGRSALVAFLFALHPAHVESVAWLSERKDVLCTLFWLATLIGYVWYVHKPSWKRFAWVVCGSACALLSKPMAVTLPFTLLLLDLWPLRRITLSPKLQPLWLSSLEKLSVEKWPLFLMAALSSVVTYIAQRSGGAMTEFDVLPLWERLANAALSYCHYLLLLVWPDPLTAFYYHQTSTITVSTSLVSAIALVLVTAFCWHFRNNKPYCLFGWLWFLGTMAPVIGIVQVGAQSMAERYTYVPYIGLFIALVWLAADAVVGSPAIKIAAQILAVAILAAFAVRTSAQVKIWKNTITLFSHALEVDPRGEFPNLTLGVAYMMQGQFDVAQRYYQRALTYNPSRPMTLSHSAYCLMQTHDPHNMPLARQRLDEALRIDPNNTYALANMAIWSYMMGDPKSEEMYSRKALATRPDLTKLRIYLGDALQLQGKLDEAAQEYRQAIAQEPDNYQAHNSLGVSLEKQGLIQEALKEFRLSLSIKPDQAAPHSHIGKILIEMHQLPEAVEEFKQEMRYAPENANSHIGLGVVLMQMGDYDKAAAQFSEALRINPSNTDAKRYFDMAQAGMKNRIVLQSGK